MAKQRLGSIMIKNAAAKMQSIVFMSAFDAHRPEKFRSRAWPFERLFVPAYHGRLAGVSPVSSLD
ncbi:MAG TPA: hypothetical protein VFE47_03330 [Tepidisphaeraceae bacterium]|jgi:hypothetical protein|nr:hypothetical protein [Tepidisphaeraceae bacterium]